jgi:hypothetical protein
LALLLASSFELKLETAKELNKAMTAKDIRILRIFMAREFLIV